MTTFTATGVADPGLSYTQPRVFQNAVVDTHWPIGGLFMPFIAVNVVVGRTYSYNVGNSSGLCTDRVFTPIPGGAYSPGGVEIPPGPFIATQTLYWLYVLPGGPATYGDPVTATVLLIA
jgi:hypothetical protein